MKKVSILTFLFLIISVGYAFSQHKFALNAGYDYMQKHTGYLGAEYRIDSNRQEHTSHGPFNVGIGTYLYGQDGKFAVTPEIHLNKTWKHFIFTEISASTKNIKPSIGLTFFNLARLQFGYSFPLQQSDFKGFSVGFHILIGRAPFYDEMRVF
ncbi:hypothetical protein [Petrimonas sp.]|uniref:hypothetical protein n=1 Tax=Petrimonas sp. TaxID=2023866 RepID=UPI003F5121EC